MPFTSDTRDCITTLLKA